MHNLNFKDIEYSNETNSNNNATQNKLHFSKDKYINLEYVSNKNDIKNILLNEKNFKKFIKNNYIDINDNDKSDDIYKNTIYMDYISRLFTTFPKPDNIKLITNIQGKIKQGLKIHNPFASNVYTYLNVNGTPHTVSRIVIYNDNKKDKKNKAIIEEYKKYIKWRSNNNNIEGIKNNMINNIFDLFDQDSKQYNLYNLFLKKIKYAIDPSNQEQEQDDYKVEGKQRKGMIIYAIKAHIEALKNKKRGKTTPDKQHSDIYLELSSIHNDITKIKEIIEKGKFKIIKELIDEKNKINTKINTIDLYELFNDGNNFDGNIKQLNNSIKEIYELVRDFNMSKTSSIIDKKLFSTTKLTDLKSLLKSFVEYSEIYENYIENIYNKNILKYDTSRTKSLQPFVKFIKMIKDKYDPNFTFKIYHESEKGEKGFLYHLKKGNLYDISRDESFESESLRIHIDLIKGKVNDENKNIAICHFNDNDLKERWDKLMTVKISDEEIDYLPYFDIEKPEKSEKPEKPEKSEKTVKTQKGGKRKTKKNNRNKHKRSTRRQS
jgi:hypothetical protein